MQMLEDNFPVDLTRVESSFEIVNVVKGTPSRTYVLSHRASLAGEEVVRTAAPQQQTTVHGTWTEGPTPSSESRRFPFPESIISNCSGSLLNQANVPHANRETVDLNGDEPRSW